MGSPAIFSGAYVKLLKDKILFGNVARILTSTVDPSVTATLGEAGSIMMRTGAVPALFLKTDAGTTTNWVSVNSTDEFSVLSVAAGVVNLAGGSIFLPSGKVLTTYDGSGSLPTDFEGNLSINLVSLMAPTVGANGYLYLDLNTLASSPTTITGTSFAVYPITASNFVMLTTTPENTDLTRYVQIAAFKGEAGPIWGAASWYNFPRKMEQNPVTFASPVAYNLAPTLVGHIGDAGQMMGGHVLDADSFPWPTNRVFWNLRSSLVDNSGLGLSLSGPAVFNQTGLFGAVNDAAYSTGVAWTITNAFFQASAPVMACGWFKLANWANGSAQAILKIGQTADYVWEIRVTATGAIVIQWSDSTGAAAYTNTTTIANPNFSNASWHHVAVSYTATELRVYLDGKLATTITLVSAIRASTTGLFTIGGGDTLTVREVCCSKTNTLIDEDIRKLAAYKITHNLTLGATSQKWQAGRVRYDGDITEEMGDQGWLIDKTNINKLYIDFFDLNPIDLVYIKCEDQSISQPYVVTTRSTYDSGWLTAAPTIPFSHGLSGAPASVMAIYEATTGEYSLLAVGDFLSWNATQFVGDSAALGTITINSSHKLRIVASVGSNALAISVASLTTSGILNTSDQHIAGNKWLQGNWIPEADNAYDLGSAALRWKTLHVGPGSVIVHYDASDTKKLTFDFDSTMARIATDAASPMEFQIGVSQVGLISTNGAWTIGPSAGGVTHSMYGSLAISATSNQLVLGAVRTLTIAAPTPATSSRTMTIPDIGADASFVLTAGAQSVGGVKTFVNGIVLGATSTLTRYTAKTLLATDKFAANNSNAQSAPVSVYYMAIGDQVTVYIPAFTLTANSFDATLTFASALPVGYRPIADTKVPISIRSSANDYTMGVCRCYANGNIGVQHDPGGNYFGAGTAGVQESACVTFIVA